MSKFKKITAWILIGVLSFGLTACSTPAPTTPEATEQASQILRYSLTADVPTLDQHLANSIPSATVGHYIFEGLIRTYQGEVRPGAAEDWEISADGLTYTFHLRDSKWSDGTPVTANDFEYGMKRLLDPATGVCQGSCRKSSLEILTGLSHTSPGNVQSRVLPDHLWGAFAFASS